MQFTVENLGKVGKADIDLKPLTIFIGKNGSGKTYVASVLWAYVSYIKSIQNNVVDFIPKDIWDKYIGKINSIFEYLPNNDISSLKYHLTIQQDEIEKIYKFAEQKIDKVSLFENCFNHKNFNSSIFSIEKIEFHDISIDFGAEILTHSISEEDEFGREYERDVDIDVLTLKITENNGIFFNGGIAEMDFLDQSLDITMIIFYRIIEYLFLWKNATIFLPIVYIPAARTGLMFGLHNFANTSLEQQNHFGVKKSVKNQYDLTAPLNDFISKLYREIVSPFSLFYHSDSKEPSSYNLIDGKITVNRQDKRFKYIPKSLNQELPLSASSSLVTETAVLSIFDNSIRKGSFVIFEEPEAHLHLSAQREMAKLIVKMINQGCYMLITTHSDTFLQQLNNLIMLNKLSENNPDILQEFNIEPDETIAGEKVAVYDFQYQDDDKTIAKPLELGDYGFIAPSVNDEINNLISQTDTIIDMIDDLKSNGE